MIASLMFRHRHRRFLAACERPLATQAARLRTILAQAEHTVIGRRRHFARIRRIGDDLRLVRVFQDAVPVRTHAEMRADLDAVHQGDWRRLCPSRPLFFAMTAGSTGRFKYVPITAEFRRELREASLVFNGALEAHHPELRSRRLQFLVGSAEGGLSPSGIPQGFVSGFNYKHFPWLVRRRFVVPYWVFTLDDAEERAYAAGRILVAERRLGALCALSPMNLVNLREALERQAERLIRDVAAGTLEPRGRSAVHGTFRTRPDPALAGVLRAARAREGALPTRLLFPSLDVLVCWQGGNMGYHLHALDESFGMHRHFEFPISASEGVFAIPHRPGVPGGALAITSHFLEFLPETGGPESTDADRSGRALRADELEPGAEYRVVVTNGGGLHRYDMEDVVRVTGRLARTPVIEFVSKAGRRTSVSNERLTELDVTHAMEAASRACGRWFREFLFVPCSDRRYRVVIDGTELGAGGDGMPALTAELERQLQVAAMGYAFEREDALLEPLEMLVTAPGQLNAHLRRSQPAPPIPSAQAKPLRLTNEFDVHQQLVIERTYAA
jgi:hypothetical protein